jgi:MFS family permease
MSNPTALLPDVPRNACKLLGGECLAAVGSGLTLPFLLVYLHRVRGIDMELAGLAMACLGAAGFLGNPLGGSLSDRIGPRRTLVGGLIVLSAGALAVALVQISWHAFAAVALMGLGWAVVMPAQDALLATLAGPGGRGGAFSLRYATMNLGLGVGSVAGALIADVATPRSFEALFVAQGLGCAAFAAIALGLPDAPGTVGEVDGEARGAYRRILADRPFRRLLPIVTVLFAAGYAQYQAAFPAYATGVGGVGASALGAAFAANTFTIVALQLIVLRLVAGWRRSRGLALVGCLWAAAWIVALAAGGLGGSAYAAAAFCLTMVLFGVGETFLAATLGPLVNDLAPDDLRGRYNGACALASTGGLVLGPAAAGIALGAGLGGPLLAGLVLLCGLAAVGGLALERALPDAAKTAVAARHLAPQAAAA